MKKLFMTVSLLVMTESVASFDPASAYFSACDALTEEMKRCFHEHGFIVLKDFLTFDECQALKNEACALVEKFDIERYCEVFVANKPSERSDYFAESADKVYCFLEPKALKDGALVCEKKYAVNKIGHALHDKNPIFKKVSFSPRIIQYACDIGITHPLIVQSMVIFKSAYIGDAVPPHQDATFLYTDPVSVNGFWIALDGATIENSCLWVIPGSHKEKLRQRFKKDEQGRLAYETFDATPWAHDQFVPVPVEQGSLIIFSGTLAHKSEPNLSSDHRNAYTFHVISGDAQYTEDNWLQRKDMPKLGW